MTANADKLREIIGAGIYYLDRLISASQSLSTSQQIAILQRATELKEMGREAGLTFQGGNEGAGLAIAMQFLSDCISYEESIRSTLDLGGIPRRVMSETLRKYTPRQRQQAPVQTPVTVQATPGSSSDALGLVGLALGIAGLIMKGRGK